MERVTIYLRTALFSPERAQPHIPSGVVMIEGRIIERPAGCVTIEADKLYDSRGRELQDLSLTRKELQLPWAKIDHLEILDR